jgi:glutathione S-transferase
VQVARYLAKRYGHTPGCAAGARARLVEILALLDATLESSRAAGQRYFFGDRPTALDIYVACAMNVLAPLSAEQCPAHPVVLATYAWTQRQLGDSIPQSLVEHRDHMYATHLTLPLQF